MNKWWWLLLIILCYSAVGFAIFGEQQRLTCTDAPSPTKVGRIVSMAPNLTEILFTLGIGEKIVGVTTDSDYPPAAVKIPKVGTFWQPNIEAVISAKPNLVITLGFEQQRNLARRLKRIGYNCLTVNIEKVSGLFDAIEKIGAATATQSQANQLVSHIKKKLDELSTSVGRDHRIRVLYVVQRQPLRVAGRDTFINEMIELAGGENAVGPTVHKYPPIGAEQVYACRADVIIEPTMGQKDPTAQQDSAIEYWSRFKNVPAVANKRIYVIDGDMVARLGPRLDRAVEAIAKCLRPELFEN
jgi:iron complex transport system substrate-binding protein